MKRIESLDALRGITALLVVFYHYSTRYYELYPQFNPINFNIEFGKFGINNFILIYKNINDYINLRAYKVSLFFLVSGFVISISLKGDNNFGHKYV